MDGFKGGSRSARSLASMKEMIGPCGETCFALNEGMGMRMGMEKVGIGEARHFTTRIMLKPIDDPHVDLIATVSSPLDHKPEENIIGNALFRWQSDVHDPHTFVDLYVLNSDQILQMRSCAYYPRYGFGAYGIFPLLLKKRESSKDFGQMGLRYGSKNLSCGVSLMSFASMKKLDCQILIQGKERGRCDVDSCGVHVISWLQMWDATEQEDGYTMPSYSMDEIQENFYDVCDMTF
ncbi:hypothetical protein K1719_029650 [Acacia pycnantha]|nr:hypothetical protein K1719_029650 [Acacia pycnantha]